MTRSKPHSFNARHRGAGTSIVAILLLWLVLLEGCGREAEEPAPGASGATTTPMSSRELVMGTSRAPARPTTLTPAPAPATKPTAPLAPGTSCVTAECHATFAAAPQIHAPVAERACDSCHGEDVGTHRFPLKRSASDSCTFCHSVSGSESHQHKALEQGCLSCHEAHVSRTKFLLKSDSVEQLCLSCHELPLKRFAHGPVAQGQCTLCHQPHQANNAMLLRGGEGAAHCFTCHGELQAALTSSRTIHPPAVRDCGECHAPHATDHPYLLNNSIDHTCLRCHDRVQKHVATAPVQHAAMTDGESCLNCHVAHAADHSLLMKRRMDNVCLTCHDRPLKAEDGRTIASMKPALTASKFLHGAIRAGDCSACHDAHGARENALLVRAFPSSTYARFEVGKYALCFESCHSSEIVTTERTTALTNFRDGDVNLHFLHVNRDEKGRSCKTCHALHGSNLPNHMASEVSFERSGWAMPIGFEKRTDGGSCAPGCHAPRRYDRGGEGAPAATTAPSTAPSLRGVP